MKPIAISLLAAMLASATARGQQSVHVTEMTFTGVPSFGAGHGHAILQVVGRFTLPVMEFDFKFSGCHNFVANAGDSSYVAESKSDSMLRILIPAGGDGRMEGCTLKTRNVHVLPISTGVNR